MQEHHNTSNHQFAMVSETKSADDLVFTAINMLKTVKLALQYDNLDGNDTMAVSYAVDQTRVLLEVSSSAQEKYMVDVAVKRLNDLGTIDTLFAAYRDKLSAFNALAVDGNLPDESLESDAFHKAVRMLFCYPCKTLEGVQHRVRLIQGDSTLNDFLFRSDEFHLFVNSMSGDIGRQQ